MRSKNKDGKIRRENGVLLPLFSLSGKYGIGSMGREAYRFIDFLRAARQTYWQLLPLCPVGKGNSPYSSTSSFAGEILLIDMELLADDGFLEPQELPPEPENPQKIDYDAVRAVKLPLLRKAAERFDVHDRDFRKFANDNADWLDDFAVFSAIKQVTGDLPIGDFPEGLKYRIPEAMDAFIAEHFEVVEFYRITQYFFYRQYFSLKAYAERNGIRLIGDLPFYVQLESADVWSNPSNFRLGRDLTPVLVAGVPPDAFSDEGQLWGNPIYDWNYLRSTGYAFWKTRLRHQARLYDVIRIDHFRAFADYYTCPYGAKDAKSGVWEKGVGLPFWQQMQKEIGAEIIAEDLGTDSPEVRRLITDTGFPNMKVLQFAFDSDLENPHLPKNYERNCVCYTGTHDNDTTRGWFEKADAHRLRLFSQLVPADESHSAVYSLIRYAVSSKARIVMVPMQDYLQLDSSARLNTPGVPTGNWEWRLVGGELTEELCQTIIRLCKTGFGI